MAVFLPDEKCGKWVEISGKVVVSQSLLSEEPRVLAPIL